VFYGRQRQHRIVGGNLLVRGLLWVEKPKISSECKVQRCIKYTWHVWSSCVSIVISQFHHTLCLPGGWHWGPHERNYCASWKEEKKFALQFSVFQFIYRSLTLMFVRSGSPSVSLQPFVSLPWQFVLLKRCWHRIGISSEMEEDSTSHGGDASIRVAFLFSIWSQSSILKHSMLYLIIHYTGTV